jgi:hypothetical protein
MAQRAVTPHWWPYSNVCDRKGCQTARDDALLAIVDAREKYDDLIHRIVSEGERLCWENPGFRTDAFAQMDSDDKEWWALSIAKDTEKP